MYDGPFLVVFSACFMCFGGAFVSCGCFFRHDVCKFKLSRVGCVVAGFDPQRLLQSLNLGMLFLVEMRRPTAEMEEVRHCLGFSHVLAVDAHGSGSRGGGLAILWH